MFLQVMCYNGNNQFISMRGWDRMNELSAVQQSYIIDYLRERVKAHTIILFGSAARGNMRADSDVDLAYMSEEDYAPYDLFMIAQGLADYLGREVDLVDFRQASSVFKAQIVGTGRLLLDNEPVQRQYAFMRALKEYAKLNEERHAILVKQGYARG